MASWVRVRTWRLLLVFDDGACWLWRGFDLGLEVLGWGLRGWSSTSCVMVGILVPMSPVSSDVTTARGYVTINPLVVLLLATLGAGRSSSAWVKTVCCTLGGVAKVAIASVSKLVSCFLVCFGCTLGDAVGSALATI